MLGKKQNCVDVRNMNCQMYVRFQRCFNNRIVGMCIFGMAATSRDDLFYMNKESAAPVVIWYFAYGPQQTELPLISGASL